jgi:4-hydroxybenzoate polyprenyltransferase
VSEIIDRPSDVESVPSIPLPLCIDMDGTLLRTDTLHESAAAAVFADWRAVYRLPIWLARGKANLKRELARRWNFDPATLPYNRLLVEHIHAEASAGRRVVLCTAADRIIAEKVAGHLGVFDEVIATDGDRNLRGAEKAALLTQRFGRGGFIYAGNDSTDLPVWDCAADAIAVNAPAAVRREVASRHPAARFVDDRAGSSRAGRLRATLRALRPYQWVKNGLCLVPPLVSGDIADSASWAGALVATLAFCLIASSIYLLNDIGDLSADRAHQRKRGRPFASGDVPIAIGLALAPLLLIAGVTLGALSGALLAVGLYVVGSVGYNVGLKQKPLVDVFVLAGLYTCRLFGGGQASGHAVSLWLLGFSSFLFLALAIIKRVSELQHATSGQRIRRRGYSAADLGILQMLGCASTFSSAIVLSLYVQSDAAFQTYGHPELLWGSIPLLLFWQCRLWLSTARGYMHDDPIVFAARDWVSWAVLACLLALAAVAWLPSS